ncbi:class Ib ribonucleoside-diphosphate reductase assembly flavoprotein NrdI [Mycoplasma phocoenae]|nr:class Ib ribonucleoside-diphosphate reductase assembly flavoprotein NrdI [Mycoplasma phocoenae]
MTNIDNLEENKLINARTPEGDIHVVYFSSMTENTKKFVTKLNVENTRIPYDENETIEVKQDYVLISPTYSGGLEDFKGSVPKQVKQFLNNENNRKHCVAVIGSGNTNFGDTYGLAGYVLSAKLQVPLMHIFELIGTAHDVKTVNEKLKKLWTK